jgi:hypothetical protein
VLDLHQPGRDIVPSEPQILYPVLALKGNMCLNFDTSTLRRNRICLGFGWTANAVTAAFALVLVLVLGALAASPSLHQRLHDSHHPDHFCIICALGGGQLNVAESTPVVATDCVFLSCGVLGAEPRLVSRFDFSFSPSRAPPRR